MKFYQIIIALICVSLSGCGFLDRSSTEHTSPPENNSNSEDVNQVTDDKPNENINNPEPNESDPITDAPDEQVNDEVKPEPNDPKEDTDTQPPATDQPNDDEKDSEEQEPSIPTVANPASITVMVNKTVTLPDGYRPTDLVRPNVTFYFGNQKLEKALLRQEAATALENMFNAAKKEGINLIAASGFRSYDTQAMLFENEVKQFGYEKASMAVAYPGTSEHQTGLAMDITAASVNYSLTETLGKKPEGQWLEKNAHKFGFILRYPLGKESITGYQYEPWHFRYVGTEISIEMFEKGLTLEEYYEQKEGI